MAFTEFCCRSGGSNLNAGTLLGDSTEPGTSASFSYAGTFTTNTFTVSSGNPSTDGVTAGMFVHVNDGSAVGRIARVTSVTSTTIVLSATATVGSGTGATVANVGGAWAGPSGTSGFPFNVTTSDLKNASADGPRINFKNSATYSITAAITCNTGGPVCYRGYATAYGDTGKAVIDGGTSGASYVLLTFTLNNQWLENFVFQNNGATGSATGLNMSGGGVRSVLTGVVVNSVRGTGITLTSGSITSECEAYSCNQSNTSGRGGFQCSTGILIRCIAHDNTGSNNTGFLVVSGGGSPQFIQCIADTNGRDGFNLATTSGQTSLVNCDAYNNSRDGIRNESAGNTFTLIESCNLTRNAGWGVNISSIVNTAVTRIVNCGFGSGSEANTSGTTTGTTYADVSGTVTYASNASPYTDPANGDFRISLAAAKNTGYGTFLQTDAGYAGTIGYPDIGAAQSSSAGGGSGIPTARGMHGGMR